MPNRSLQAKHERAMRQRQERASIEYGKSGYQTAKPFEADAPKREKLSQPRKVQWFDRQAKRVAYIPAPAKRREIVGAPLLAAWAEAGQVTLYRNGAMVR